MKYAALVLKNLMRNKRRTALTVFSIAVSLFIFAALTSMPTLVNQVLAQMSTSRRLVVHNKAGLTYGLPPAYLPKIIAVPGVEAAVAQSWFGGIYHDISDQFPNWALDTDGVEKVFPDWGVPPEVWEQFKKARRACLVGPQIMARFNFKVGQQIMLRPAFPMYPQVQLEIVGALGDKAPPNVLVFRRDYLQEAVKALNGRSPFVDTMWVMPQSEGAAPRVQAAIDEEFANSSAETQTETEKAFVGNFMNNYRMILNLAEVLGFIVVVTIGLVAANTAAMSIRERRGEIAVLRSMGFPSHTILSLLIGESLIIGLCGGLIGAGAAALLLRNVSLGGMGPMSSLRMPPLVLLESLIVAIVIGVLSALVPARAAARRSIVESLRMVA
jgi:putative ABC transport system permease protein